MELGADFDAWVVVMKMRPALSLIALLLAGCPSGPDLTAPPEIDLAAARKLEEEGKKFEALAAYAKIITELTDSGRADARAHAAWGRVLMALRRIDPAKTLKDAPPEVLKRCAALVAWRSPEGLAFLNAGAAGHWNHLLSLGAEPPVLGEAAGAVADLFEEKLDDASLRRGRLEPEGDLSERLYRRCLAQAAAEYARYAVSRMPPKDQVATRRAGRFLRRYAKETRELAALPGVLPGAAARWAELADKADDDANLFRPDREGDRAISNDLRQDIEIDTNGLLMAAIDCNNKSNDLMSRRAAESEILESLERSLRHFVAGRESLVDPSPAQKRRLDVMTIAADALRHQAFKN